MDLGATAAGLVSYLSMALSLVIHEDTAGIDILLVVEAVLD